MPQIYSLALVVAVASGLAIVFRRWGQPLVVSYIIAGALLSLLGWVRVGQLAFLSFLPDIGLAFLLFLVGMELDLREFRSLGKNVIIAAIAQVAITTVLLDLFLLRWGYPSLTSLLTGMAVSFSSTILVVKLLLEGKELLSLHGKLAVGILLLEDLLAIVLLMLISVAATGSMGGIGSVLLVLLKGTFLIWLALYAGKRLLPAVLKLTSENTELLFLTAIGWCLVFVSVSLLFGFSLAIGAFLSGVSLAQSVYRVQISGRVKPLRDFFIMLFFIDLGTNLSWSTVQAGLGLALILLGYAVLVKPAIFFGLFTLLRFRVHPAFQTGISLSSISEFSLIMLFLAARGNLVSVTIVSPVILASVLSFVGSSFLITHRKRVYAPLKDKLKRLERKKTLSFDFVPSETEFRDQAVLVGCHRSGQIILPRLRKLFGDNVVVVDFNPEVIEKLRSSFVQCIYGDIADPEVLERLHLKAARLVISTVRDLADNLTLLDSLEKVQSKAVVIITAADTKEAVTLYERGVHHVSLPLALEGTMISRLISDYQDNWSGLTRERERKLGELKRSIAI